MSSAGCKSGQLRHGFLENNYEIVKAVSRTTHGELMITRNMTAFLLVLILVGMPLAAHSQGEGKVKSPLN